MAIYLNEGQYGYDAGLVGFPHLLVCMGLVVVTRTRMFGIHLDKPADTVAYVTALQAYIQRLHSQPRALYGSCNFDIRYPGNVNRRRQWEAEMATIAGLLNFHGPAHGFDTHVIAPRDGTYVEYDRNLNQPTCQIRYKRHEKMTYTYVGNPAHPLYKLRPGFGSIPVAYAATGAAVYAESKAGLHTVTVRQLISIQL